MTPKEKFNDIDFSKVPEKAQIAAKTIKPALFDKKYQAEQYTDTRKQAESQMNALYDKLLQSYPESIKSKAAKQPEPKTPQAMAVQAAQATIKQPTVKKPKATAGANNRGNVTKLAKEIRKEGEAWHAAMKRAGEMVNKEKGKAVKKANAQYEKLKAFLAKNPSIEKTMVTYGKKPNQGTRPLDVRRDASRVAKPKGKRISADGKTYYEYRANRTDSSRKRYPYLELGGKLFGAGSFAKGGKTKKEEKGNYDSFTKAFLSHGFKKKKSYAGIDFFEKKKDDRTYYGSLDLKNRIVGVEDDYGNSLYNYGGLGMFQNEYFIERLFKVLDKIDKKKSSFAKGGEFGHTFNGAGKFEDGGYMAKGEDYEYYNKFGLEQSDFEKIVEVWHMHEKTPTEEVEKQYNMVLDAMEDKYGEAKIDDVVDDIHHRHGLMKIMNYAKGGKTGKRLVMYFYFNANDLNISILSPLLEKYTKDWEMFDDKYRMVRAYVKESEAKDLKNELNSYGAVNTITTEKAPDRYAYEGGIRHYAKGGKTGKRLLMYFYFSANDLNISILSPLLEKYTKDWEMFDDKYRMVRAYVKESEAKDLKNELNSYGAVNDITTEKAPDRYAYEGGIRHYAEGGKTNNGDNLPNTVEEYFAAMNNFSMRLGEAEANFANDNGASYQRVLAERDEFFEKTKAKWYAELNEAEGNFAKDDGKSYEAALKKLDDARLRFAKGGKVKGRLSDTHKYVPNRMIQEIEVERKGKTSFIDGADILDGVYVKKGVKFAHGGSMPHVHSKKHKNG